jgi:hypothetical protein
MMQLMAAVCRPSTSTTALLLLLLLLLLLPLLLLLLALSLLVIPAMMVIPFTTAPDSGRSIFAIHGRTV